MARLPDKQSLGTRARIQTASQGGVRSALRDQQSAGANVTAQQIRAGQNVTEAAAQGGRRAVTAGREKLKVGEQAINVEEKLAQIEQARGQLAQSREITKGEAAALPGETLAAISQIALQAEDRIRTRQETVNKAKAIEAYTKSAEDELLRIQTEDDLSETETGKAYNQFLDQKLGEVLGDFNGRPEAMAALESRLIGIRGSFSSNAAQQSVTLQAAKVATIIDTQTNQIAAKAYDDPGSISNLFEEVDSIVDDMAPALTPQQEINIREQSRANILYNAITALVDNGSVSQADNLVQDNPSLFRYLNPNQSRALQQSISSAKERQFGVQFEQQAAMDELQYIAGGQTDVGTQLRYFAQIKAGNSPARAFEIASGRELTEEEKTRADEKIGTGNFKVTTPYQTPDGTIHVSRFNPETGPEILTPQGWQQAPADARAVPTNTASVINMDKFFKMQDELLTDRQHLEALANYARTRGDIKQGFGVLADKVIASAKTLAGEKLNPAELKTLIANGQLQRQLGAIRTDVLGPGVMTEYDAQRLVDSLGGNVSLLSNKEVVADLLEGIYREKAQKYELHQQQFNIAAPSFGVNPDTYKPGDIFGGGIDIPQEAINMLKSEADDPQAIVEFDQMFGQGAAQRILGNGGSTNQQ